MTVEPVALEKVPVVVYVLLLVTVFVEIVPAFEKIFKDFDTTLPDITIALITVSQFVQDWWFMLPLIPVSLFLFVKLLRLNKL